MCPGVAYLGAELAEHCYLDLGPRAHFWDINAAGPIDTRWRGLCCFSSSPLPAHTSIVIHLPLGLKAGLGSSALSLLPLPPPGGMIVLPTLQLDSGPAHLGICDKCSHWLSLHTSVLSHPSVDKGMLSQ